MHAAPQRSGSKAVWTHGPMTGRACSTCSDGTCHFAGVVVLDGPGVRDGRKWCLRSYDVEKAMYVSQCVTSPAGLPLTHSSKSTNSTRRFVPHAASPSNTWFRLSAWSYA